MEDNERTETAEATMRDQFAMAALTAIMTSCLKDAASCRFFMKQDDGGTSKMSTAAYRYADAMMKARQTNDGEGQ